MINSQALKRIQNKKSKTEAAPGQKLIKAPSLLLVIESLGTGGAERQLSEMANYWAKNGYNVTLATWAGRDVVDFYGLHNGVHRAYMDVVSYPTVSRVRSYVERIMKLRELIATNRPDVVLSFMDVSNVMTIVAGIFLRRRVVVSIRTDPSRDVTLGMQWRILRLLVYPLCKVLVVQTEHAARWCKYRMLFGKVVVIPNSLRKLPEIRCEREPLILAVGRLAPEKGIDVLIKAFSITAKSFPNWRLVLIGEGPERGHLIQLCQELQIDDRVLFLGVIVNVEEWMARAGLFVQASRFEGFPNTLLESMAMGAAVISSDRASGPVKLVEDGVNGRVVPAQDADALAGVMAQLMADTAIRQALGREAVKVKQRYDQGVIMARWKRCLGIARANT